MIIHAESRSERGLENHIDYLGLFHRVYASLMTRDFPAELTTASKLQQAYLDEHKNAKNPAEIIEGFGGVFDETYDRFAMQYSFKTEEDGKGDRSRNFIFNDLQFHSVFEGENAFIDIDTDLQARQNWLRFTKRRPTEKDGGVLSLLASVKGCLTYFQNGTRTLSFNYKHHKDEDKRPGDDDYTLENAIESVLTEFHLSREQIRYDYPTFHLSMDCFWCEVVGGTINLLEAEDAKWLTKDTLYDVQWLPADITLISTIGKMMG